MAEVNPWPRPTVGQGRMAGRRLREPLITRPPRFNLPCVLPSSTTQLTSFRPHPGRSIFVLAPVFMLPWLSFVGPDEGTRLHHASVLPTRDLIGLTYSLTAILSS